MTSELFRWQAAMGCVAGALVGDAMASNAVEWTPSAIRSIELAERMLAGSPVAVDLAPGDAVAVAVGLSTGPPPLLVDSSTIEFIDAVRQVLQSGVRPGFGDPLLAEAAEIARAKSFVDAIGACGNDATLARQVGAIAGLEGGLGAVPARPVSELRSPDRRKGRRYLCGLTNRLLGVERPKWYDSRNRRGPREVLPGLWVSNLLALPRFTGEHPDGLVLSLCDDEGRVGDHPHHVTFHIEDTPKTDANPSLAIVLDEILDEVATARAAGRPVLVHCRQGASRTGLVLRLVLVDELGLSADDALVEAQCLWPHTSTWNDDWTREIERRISASV